MGISKRKMADKDDARESLQLDQATLEAIIDGVASKLRQGSAATGSGARLLGRNVALART